MDSSDFIEAREQDQQSPIQVHKIIVEETSSSSIALLKTEQNANNAKEVEIVSQSSSSSSAETNAEEEEDAQSLTTEEREDRLEKMWKKPTQSSFSLVQGMMLEQGLKPSQILQSLLGSDCRVPVDITESSALRLLLQLVGERRFRNRLPQYNDFRHAVELFRNAKNILIITGAGVSVSCGIPDFRSSTGIYASLKKTYPALPHPQAMFDIDFFRKCPDPFYTFAKEIFPGAFQPSISHMFIRFLEEEQKLLRNYTQNIDTLERLAGIKRYVECHGSFGAATCLQCGKKYTSDDIREDILAQRIARCRHCLTGLIKPDIVFFGENLPDHFHMQMAEDKNHVDLLVVMGSSLQVQPVSLVPFNIDENVPQILINKEDLGSYSADVKLLGDCDHIITALALAMGGPIRERILEELKSRPAFAQLLSELKPRLDANPDSFLSSPISMEEMRKRIEGEESAQNPTEDQEKETEPVAAKRQKLENHEEESNENGCANGVVEASNNEYQAERPEESDASKLREMYASGPRFLAVASKLDGFAYAKFPPNLNIFKGADYFYDTDERAFGPLPRRQRSESDASDDGCCNGDNHDHDGSDSDTSSTQYCESAPDLPRAFEATTTSPVKIRNASSCPPTFSAGSSDSSSSPNSPSS